MTVASAASVGAAVGGFAASQNETEVVAAAPLLPPDIGRVEAFSRLVAGDLDYTKWSDAFGPEGQVAVNLTVAPAEWRFVGVIATGKDAKAIFSDPSNSSATLFVAKGDTLPDGRQIAKITSSEVFFAAPPQDSQKANASLSLFAMPSASAPPAPSVPN
jgi:hypothetical protein